MNKIKKIELNNQRLLTTEQLSEFYEATIDQIKNNFSRNKSKFQEGKHFYRLEGAELKEFKDLVTNSYLVDKRAPQLILWTKQGASRHSKILNTDKAWDMYDVLEENYFSKPQKLNTNKETLRILLDQEEQIEAIATDVDMLKDSMRISGSQEFGIQQAGRSKAIECLGGKDSYAYEVVSKRVFSQLWRDFKRYFKIPRYSELAKVDYNRGLEFIEAWQPDTATRLEIERLNNQGRLDIA